MINKDEITEGEKAEITAMFDRIAKSSGWFVIKFSALSMCLFLILMLTNAWWQAVFSAAILGTAFYFTWDALTLYCWAKHGDFNLPFPSGPGRLLLRKLKK